MNTRTWCAVIDLPLGPYLPMYSSTMMGLRCSHRFSYGMWRNLSSGERGSKRLMSMITETVIWKWGQWTSGRTDEGFGR